MNTHILPFLWVHGETKTTYRKMIQAIYDANLRAFCVESRTHEDFMGDAWWHDMDVILDEAAQRGMKVWIFDDKHYPTGYANGGLNHALLSQHRWNIYHVTVPTKDATTLKLKISKYIHPSKELERPAAAAKGNKNDEMVSVSAIGFLPNGQKRILNLSSYILDDVLLWTPPEGTWTVEICGASMNTGFNHNFINLMNRSSCRILLDRVYEPHYARYQELFGSVIAGFFSDEPSLGNFRNGARNNVLGTEQDLPYSDELDDLLTERLGDGWKAKLPLLWRNDYDEAETAYMRYAYMDAVSHLVEEDFSHQIGDWCREHGVEYIGHVIEDNNQHARTGNSLGHYFRGLKWQSMAGIDCIGGQVYPQGADKIYRSAKTASDGEFYHYSLGKLAASLAALNPNMDGRSICEIFGNYGWSSGVRMQKYLVDHFMVRGINHFIPHAFTGKNYPDPDCPPHFYAQGHNPEYRHFGKLMEYTERVCSMISGGSAVTPVAVLYHAEAEWTGKCMLMQKPARVLYDNQVDYLFVPADAFSDTEFYGTELGRRLIVNGHEFKTLIIPYAQFITRQLADAVIKLRESGCRVVFVDALPEGICNGEEIKLLLPKELNACPVVRLEDLAEEVSKYRLLTLEPQCPELRVMHYCGDLEFYYLFNESAKTYRGSVRLPAEGPVYAYNAWLGRNEELKVMDGSIEVEIDPSESLFIMCGTVDDVCASEHARLDKAKEIGEKVTVEKMKLRKCSSAEYPAFGEAKEFAAQKGSFRSFAETGSRGEQKENAKFSGFLQYETSLEYKSGEAELEITDAYEGVEVFVNGVSLGIQVIPSFRFNLTPYLREGQNEIMIEVATTLERELADRFPQRIAGAPSGLPTGIVGEVSIYQWN